MIRKTMILLMLLVLTSGSAWSLEIGGVELPDTLKVGKTDLLLNGAGLRRKFGIKVYAVGLYIKAKPSDGQNIIAKDEPMALLMKWRMKVPPKKIDDVFYESFAISAKAPKSDSYDSQTDYGPHSKEIVTFMGWVDKQGTTKEDAWVFKYIPGKGTEVCVNQGAQEKLMGVIQGVEFKKILFGIWLDDDPPVGKSLRKDLLGM